MTQSNQVTTPEENQNILKNIGCAWAAVWFWMGNGFSIYLGADGAPSAYIAWIWCAWTLLCVLVPLGLLVGLGLVTKPDCSIKPGGGVGILAALSAAISLVGIIAGLLLAPLAHHEAPGIIVAVSVVMLAASIAIAVKTGKEKGHEEKDL